LAVFRPKGEKLFAWSSLRRFAGVVPLGLTVIGITGCVLGFNKPAKIASSYKVLEPETWLGKELPIIKHIDIVLIAAIVVFLAVRYFRPPAFDFILSVHNEVLL